MKDRNCLRTGVLILACVLALLGTPAMLIGQAVTGSIYGSVTDSSGSILPGAVVTVISTDTGLSHSTNANDSGEFVFPVLDPGTYNISTSVPGFSRVTQRDIRLSANQNVYASFKLPPASVAREVTVDAGPTLVDTRESQIGEPIEQHRIEDLRLVS